MAHSENLGDHWQITLDAKNRTYTLSLRDDLPLWKALFLKWVKPTEVRWLYSLLQSWLASPDGMIFPDGIHHGNFKISPEVEKKVRHIFQLKPGCSIDAKSAKALTRGPLLDPEGTEILVPPHGAGTRFLLWIDQSPAYKLIGFILAVAGLWGLLF